MPPAENDRLLESLSRVQDPEIRKPLTDLGMIPHAEVADGTARITLELTIAACPAADRIRADVEAAARTLPEVEAVEITTTVMSPERRAELTAALRGERRIPFGEASLTRVIAVTSGKGGVGKSTVTVNLAVALAQRGQRVGVLDADVHGYSVPALLGSTDSPTRVGDLMMPPVAHGVRFISIGMFVEGNRSISWRGPMLHRTLEQFLRDVWWGDLDTLLIDMPPGTGDVAISLGQLLPSAEVLVVTTPQRAAADVAERSAMVARQTGQRVLGVVETMTAMRTDAGEWALFGTGGGDEAARRLGTEVLGRIPLSLALREGGDAGVPVVAGVPTDPAAQALIELAERVAAARPPLAGRSLPVQPR